MSKILVVDDETIFLDAMKAILNRYNYEVAISVSCVEGFELLRTFRPDLIFLDINVGYQDGRELCKKIKTSAEFSHIPIILISAHHDHLKFYADCGADAGIRKPFQLPILLETLEKFL